MQKSKTQPGTSICLTLAPQLVILCTQKLRFTIIDYGGAGGSAPCRGLGDSVKGPPVILFPVLAAAGSQYESDIEEGIIPHGTHPHPPGRNPGCRRVRRPTLPHL